MTDTKAASHVVDHPFTRKRGGEWWNRCGAPITITDEAGTPLYQRPCNLSEAAHRDTTLTDADRNLAPRATGTGAGRVA